MAKKETRKPRLAFRSHDFHLQQIFKELSAEHKLLGPFVFSDSGPEPYSPALSESVSRLQLSGLIGRENPDYEVVFLREAADRFYDNVLSKEFDEGEIQQLTAVAKELLGKLDLVV